MKVLHVNTHDKGGAAIACIRIHKALLQHGVESYLLTLTKSSNNIPNHYGYEELTKQKKTTISSKISKLIGKPSDKGTKKKALTSALLDIRSEAGYFSLIDTPYDITQLSLFHEADIINLHWVANFLDWPSFFSKAKTKKIVWSLHDMAPFTGGYHYAGKYNGYERKDENYPPLQDTPFSDLAEKNLARKKDILMQNNIIIFIVADSDWLKIRSQKSALFGNFDARTIYYSLDTDIFKPVEQTACRTVLGLPLDKKIVLFVCQDLRSERKGFKTLLDAIRQYKHRQDMVFCSVGNLRNDLVPSEVNHVSLGLINDQRLLSIVYNAADVFIIPSKEEAFGQTAMEAVACGTPVIAFPVGGVSEIVVHKKNGLLTKEVNATSLCYTLEHFLTISSQFDKVAISAHAHQLYHPGRLATEYKHLYQQIKL